MPTVNIYKSRDLPEISWSKIIPQFRELIAHELSCNERVLQPNEISIRLISVDDLAMIAPIEIEINAHAYAERIKCCDHICLTVRAYLKELIEIDVRVWLALSELGHSWEE